MNSKTWAGLLLAACAGLFLLLFFFDGPLDGRSDSGLPIDSEVEASESVRAAPDLADGQVLASDALLRTSPAGPDAPKAAADFYGPCIVLGRVVDKNGQAIEAASVTLTGYQGWAEGANVPRLPGRHDLHGFEQATDGQGMFRFEVPAPTVARSRVRVAADRFYDSATLHFLSSGQGALPPLTAGTRDLGDIVLVRTGAIRGRVTGEFGQPFGDVKISIGPSEKTSFGRFAYTAEDGTYVAAHAPAGTYGVTAFLEGYLREFRKPVTVALGEDTLGIDITLKSSPTIEGWVRDENGMPLAGASVGGWPKSSGRYAYAQSDKNGAFKIFLPQEDSLSLGATKEGYAPWGDERDDATALAPETRDISITMQSIP